MELACRSVASRGNQKSLSRSDVVRAGGCGIGVARRRQMPLLLPLWALSVHKSQGMGLVA